MRDADGWLWNNIRRNGFTIGEKLVLAALGDEAGSDGIFYISHRRLAEKCALDHTFVRRTFRLFRTKRLIEVYAYERDDKSYAANAYRLTVPVSEEKDVAYFVALFRDEGNRRDKFRGIINENGEVCIDPLPGLTRPRPRSEQTSIPYPVDPSTGLPRPSRGSVESGGGGVYTDRTCPDPIPAPDGKPLSTGFPISSGREKLVGAVQALLTRLPGVQIRVLNPRLVHALYRRQVSFSVIEAACWLSVGRAQKGPTAFTEIKSFRYFLPCIEEILESSDRKPLLRQAAYSRLKALGDAATDEDRQAFEATYG